MSAKLLVISAPSGCGKTTLCNKLLEDGLGLVRSISMTTRKPRPGEKDGVDYKFVSEKYFRGVINRNGFLEHEINFGNSYGTPKQFIDSNLRKGKSVLLSIDVKGAMKVREICPDQSALIFIMPPSMKVLEKRLRERNSDGESAISKRLKLAEKEMSYKDKYDHVVVNDRLDVAYRKLKYTVKNIIQNFEQGA